MAREMDSSGVNKVYAASYSIFSPIGMSTEENMKAIEEYRTGITLIDDTSLFAKPMYGAKISGEFSDPSFSTFERRAFYTVDKAINDLKDCDMGDFCKDALLILSTTKGDIDFLSSSQEMLDRKVYLKHTAQVIADYFRLDRDPMVVSNACISGVNAIISASRLISSGFCRYAIIVGADMLSRFVVTGFQSFHSVSSIPCIPYDARRDGLSLGEAVGVVILTADRSIAKYSDPIVVEGGAVSNDANHLSAPSRTGDGLASAILSSVKMAGISGCDIDFINAHGTATVYNDEMESKAVHLAGLKNVPVQSLKPYWGHTLGASGVIESIGCFWQLQHELLFGTKGFSEPGVPMELKLSSQHKKLPMKRCLKTASGFGGCNASVVYALESASKNSKVIVPARWEERGRVILNGEKGFHDIIREWNKRLDNKDLKFFKMDDLSKLGYIGVLALLKDYGELEDVPCEKRGVFLGNSSSSLNSDIRHLAAIGVDDDLQASPAIFVYTLPNVVIGEVCIKNKFKGENTFFVFDSMSREKAESTLLKHASLTDMELVVVGWCDLLGDHFDLNIALYKRVV